MREVLRSPTTVAGGIVVVLLCAAAVLAPVVAPYDPHDLVGDSLQPPSLKHLLGTNVLGQDLFSQILWGTRPALTVGLGTAGLALALGIIVGVGSGLLGGVVDMLAMRVVDVFLSVPRLPLLILVAAMAGSGRTTLVISLGLTLWPVSARLLRSQVLSLRERGYVSAAAGFGAGRWYAMRRHLIPAVAPMIVAGFVAVAGVAVLLEAGLAFLGLSDPTAVSWGLILNRALAEPGLYFSTAWTWSVLPAGFAITGLVLGLMFLGVGVEPILNRRIGSTR